MKTVELRTFGDSEWSCYAGAEEFGDKSQPMFAELKLSPAYIGGIKVDDLVGGTIVDANGIALYVTSGKYDLGNGFMFQSPCGKDEALKRASDIMYCETIGETIYEFVQWDKSTLEIPRSTQVDKVQIIRVI
jgi:hypothetical protein